ncbi:MAG: hypothetical protein JNL03_13115 [Prolixibacteraceae bacterium]|nr:hypothetical protein [Prolixibacteraceae bacterium]
MLLITLLSLTSISQWFLFAGIALILYGWIEKKEALILSGQFSFVALGLLAAWVLLNYTAGTAQVAGNHIPKEIKTLAYFKGLILFAGLSLVTLVLKLIRFRFYKISLFVLILFALMMFFMVFNILQTAN